MKAFSVQNSVPDCRENEDAVVVVLDNDAEDVVVVDNDEEDVGDFCWTGISMISGEGDLATFGRAGVIVTSESFGSEKCPLELFDETFLSKTFLSSFFVASIGTRWQISLLSGFRPRFRLFETFETFTTSEAL